MKPKPQLATFNSPFEAGIRAVALVGAAFPETYDLQRLVALDYLLVHTGDYGGPVSLHPSSPLRSAELLVRRGVVEQALLLMMTRDLISREVTPEGIRYRAGENAAPFLGAMTSKYSVALRERALWLVRGIGARTDQEFRVLIRHVLKDWVEEFQNAERSLGAAS